MPKAIATSITITASALAPGVRHTTHDQAAELAWHEGIEEIGITPSCQYAVIRVTGEIDASDYPDGTYVLVNLACRIAPGGGDHVIRDGSALVVRRCQRMVGQSEVRIWPVSDDAKRQEMPRNAICDLGMVITDLRSENVSTVLGGLPD